MYGNINYTCQILLLLGTDPYLIRSSLINGVSDHRSTTTMQLDCGMCLDILKPRLVEYYFIMSNGTYLESIVFYRLIYGFWILNVEN